MNGGRNKNSKTPKNCMDWVQGDIVGVSPPWCYLHKYNLQYPERDQLMETQQYRCKIAVEWSKYWTKWQLVGKFIRKV